MSKVFDRERFMNNAGEALLKAPFVKKAIGDAGEKAFNWDVKGAIKGFDAGIQKQMDIEFQRLYQFLPSTFLKEAMIRFIIFTNLLVVNGLKQYGINVDATDAEFETQLANSAANMGGMMKVLAKALDDPEVMEAYYQFQDKVMSLLQKFLQVGTLVLKEYKEPLIQEGYQFVELAGELGQAAANAGIKGFLSALGSIPPLAPVINLARMNAAVQPLMGKSMQSATILSGILEKINDKTQKISGPVSDIGGPLGESYRASNKMFKGITKHTDSLHTDVKQAYPPTEK